MRFRMIDGREIPAVTTEQYRGRARDLAALQADTGWSMTELDRKIRGWTDDAGVVHPPLELVGMQAAIFLTWRKRGRLISWARAGELLDDVDDVILDPAEQKAVDEAEAAAARAAAGDEDPDDAVDVETTAEPDPT